MKRFLALSILAASVAGAAVVVTQRTGPHELVFNGAVLGSYENHQACIDAIPAPTSAASVELQCRAVTHITATGQCDEVQPPAFEARLDHFACAATARQSYGLVEVYGLERTPYPACGWREVGRRLLSCNDPLSDPWPADDPGFVPEVGE